MEIDELKAAWGDLDQRITRLEIPQTYRNGSLSEQAKSQLRMIGMGLIFQVAAGLGLAVLGGSWWVGHWGAGHLVASGMAVQLYGIALIALAIAQLVAWRVIDFSGPVLDVQTQIARLRVVRARAERVLLVAGAVIWLPMTLMLFSALGIDLWVRSPATVWLNLGVGVLAAAAVAAAMRIWPDAFETLAFGGDLRSANADLADAE